MSKSYSLMAIVVTGTVLRLYNLTAISLWHDESFSALLIRYPLKEMLARIALDVHPPLYYLLLRAWDFVSGDSLLSLRLFSAFFGILTVYFSYLLIKEAFKNERLALISALLIAVNPFQIQYSVEARMYTLGTFLIVLATWLLIKALEGKNIAARNGLRNACRESFDKCDWLAGLAGKNSKLNGAAAAIFQSIKSYQWWILYGLSAALAIYTHYYLIFSVVAQAVFILFLAIKNHRADIKRWLADNNIRGAMLAYLVAFAAYIPWLGVFLKQLGQVEENYWIPKMTASSIPNTLWRMIGGSNVDLSSNGDVNNMMLAIISFIFVAVLISVFKKERNNCKNLIILSFLVPFVLAIALSAKRSLYLDRYFVFAGLFYLAIFAIFFENIKNKLAKSAAIAVFAAASLFLFYQNWKIISPQNKPGMKDASAYIFKNARPDEKVFVGSTFVFFTYKYYAYQNLFYAKGYPADFNPSALKIEDNIAEGYRIYPDYLTPLLYTPGITRVEQLPHFSGTALLTANDLLNDFNDKVRAGNMVWVLWTTGFGSSKPETPKNWRQLDEAVFQDVFGYRGKIGATKYLVQ